MLRDLAARDDARDHAAASKCAAADHERVRHGEVCAGAGGAAGAGAGGATVTGAGVALPVADAADFGRRLGRLRRPRAAVRLFHRAQSRLQVHARVGLELRDSEIAAQRVDRVRQIARVAVRDVDVVEQLLLLRERVGLLELGGGLGEAPASYKVLPTLKCDLASSSLMPLMSITPVCAAARGARCERKHDGRIQAATAASARHDPNPAAIHRTPRRGRVDLDHRHLNPAPGNATRRRPARTRGAPSAPAARSVDPHLDQRRRSRTAARTAVRPARCRAPGTAALASAARVAAWRASTSTLAPSPASQDRCTATQSVGSSPSPSPLRVGGCSLRTRGCAEASGANSPSLRLPVMSPCARGKRPTGTWAVTRSLSDRSASVRPRRRSAHAADRPELPAANRRRSRSTRVGSMPSPASS